MTIIIFIIILTILILSHEFGHFIVAKKSGMIVEEFGIGFPPCVYRIKKNGTVYSINLIPFGGFVKIKGEDGETSNAPDSFAAKPATTKLLVLAAGAVFNFILGYLLFVALAFYDVAWYAVLWRGFEYLGTATVLTVQAVYDVLKIAMSGGNVSEFITGPIGIVSIVGDTLSSGLPFLIQLTAFLSVNLAIINILPIPALDGGRVFVILIETATRRKINPRVSSLIHAVGFAVLLLLLAVVTFYDIGKIL